MGGKLPLKGMDWRDVLRELYLRFLREPKHLVNDILGSMTTMPHPVALEAYRLFMTFNANDPIVFKETARLEEEVIEMIGEILGRNCVKGLITCSGSEANLSALYLAREHGYRRVYVARTAHNSIFKAARILSMDVVEVSLTKDYKLDKKDLEVKLERHGEGVIVATAGTTGLGTVDDVEGISRIALKHDSVVHVDAAFGGFIIPFLKRQGWGLPDIGFSNRAVMSVTIDPHKLGLAPIPAGGLVVRDEEWFKPLIFNVDYMPARYQIGLGGTRSGGGVAATWAIMKLLGIEGYTRLATELMDKTLTIVKRIDESKNLSVPVRPETPIVCIQHRGSSEYILRKLMDMGIYLYLCGIIDGLRIVVMPHITLEQLLKTVDLIEKMVS